MSEHKKVHYVVVVTDELKTNKPPLTARLVTVKPKAELNDVTVVTTTNITCKYCGSKNVVKNGTKGNYQYYLCRNCGHAFAGNDALPGMKFPPDQIANALNMFYDGLSLIR